MRTTSADDEVYAARVLYDYQRWLIRANSDDNADMADLETPPSHKSLGSIDSPPSKHIAGSAHAFTEEASSFVPMQALETPQGTGVLPDLSAMLSAAVAANKARRFAESLVGSGLSLLLNCAHKYCLKDITNLALRLLPNPNGAPHAGNAVSGLICSGCACLRSSVDANLSTQLPTLARDELEGPGPIRRSLARICSCRGGTSHPPRPG
jgi:hypothetical protein